MTPPSGGRLRHRGAGVVALVLAGAVVGAGALGAAALVAGELPGRSSWAVAPVAAATLVGAVAWPRGREWASTVADRVAHGGPRSTEDVLRAVVGRDSSELPDAEALIDLAAALRRQVAASVVEIWRADDLGRLVPAAAVPGPAPTEPIDVGAASTRTLRAAGVVGRAWMELWLPALLDDRPAGEVRAVPVTHAGALLGLVVVARADGAARFGADVDAALAELGGRLGVVLHNRDLDAALRATLADLRHTNDELRASRVRLVATADAERRRIERDLHDGAQQHLVALAVHLRLAEGAIADDPSAAPEVLGALHDELRLAIAELRTLAHGIYPPLLMDSGLVEALRVAADRSPSPVTLTAGSAGRYAPEVEAAAYFCCLEALQNAAKHAPGAAVRVHVEEVGGQLSVAVEDDGPGFDADLVRPGHGLANMADRLGAVGGDLTVSSDAGGTQILGRIPVDELPWAASARAQEA